MNRSVLFVFLVVMAAASCYAQPSSKMDFETYDPVSTLVVPEHKVTKAKFPFIDVHNHQWSMASQDLTNLITDMDKLNMKVMVNLSGGNGNDKGQVEFVGHMVDQAGGRGQLAVGGQELWIDDICFRK